MKIKHLLLAAVIMLAGSTLTKAQQNMENALSIRLQHLAVISCLEAKGDIAELEKSINAALDAGVNSGEIKEALSHLYAYTGFPRSLNGLGALQRVLQERKERGIADAPAVESSPLPSDYDALAQGTKIQTQLTGRPFDYTFAPATDYYLKAHLFGDIFARDVLSFTDRELVTLSALSGLQGVEPQLKAHVSGARNMGLSDAQIHAIPSVLASRVGEAEAYRARKAIAEVFGEQFTGGAPVDFSVWPKGELNTAYAQYFIGNSYLAPMGAVTNVTFEPRCRNNWHIHHKSVQVLICVAGRGWYVEEGKEPVQMVPGTVIAIPAEAKHWHGAAKDSWFQHLTYMTEVEEEASNEWLEPVTDQEYDKLP